MKQLFVQSVLTTADTAKRRRRRRHLHPELTDLRKRHLGGLEVFLLHFRWGQLNFHELLAALASSLLHLLLFSKGKMNVCSAAACQSSPRY